MNLLIHDIAAAIERDADERAPRRARLDLPGQHLRPWEPAPQSGDAPASASGEASERGDRA